MKKDSALSCLCGTALAFLLSTGAVGCLATAFDLNLSPELTLFYLICAGFFSLCFQFRHGGMVSAGAMALAAGYMWQGTDLLLQIEALVNHISRYFAGGYGWSIISWSGEPLGGVPHTLAFGVIGCLICFVAAWVVCHNARALWAVLVCALPLGICAGLTDTVPAVGYLAMVLFSIVMLLMTQTIRRYSPREGNRLAAMLVIPLALAVAVLFFAVPQAGYTPPDEDLGQQVAAWFQDLQFGDSLVEQVGSAFSGQSNTKVDLKNTGPRGRQRYKVMEVTAAVNGPLYLRGQAYDTYNGYSWTVSDGAAWDSAWNAPYQGKPLGQVTITTKSVHDVLYTPYNPTKEIYAQMEQGRLDNGDRLKTYSFEQLDTGGDGDAVMAWAEIGFEQFVALPQDTRAAAEAFLQAHLGADLNYGGYLYDTTVAALANEIAALVRGSASYDLNTARMPRSETDFAMWFLEESDTGYCVHFASAATVLLRAAGIPARYITGYLTDGTAGEAVTVRGADAHAWAEYWTPGRGWVLLEATPGSGSTAGEMPHDTTAPIPEDMPPDSTVDAPPDDPTQNSTEADQPGSERPLPFEDDKTGGKPSDSAAEQPANLSWPWPALPWYLWTALGMGVLWLQRRLRLWLLHRWLHQGDANAQALHRWREAQYLSKVVNVELPAPLELLAQKAKFSQHSLTAEELEQFRSFRENVVACIQGKNFLYRLVCRVIFVIY